jgi:hypothetical protein
MQPTRPIRDTREVTGVEGCRLVEGEHTFVHSWSRWLHQVIDQRITAAAIGVQYATYEIEPGSRERLAYLPY